MASEGVDGSDLEASDASLIEAHLADDPDAFGQLFRRHRDRLWAVALRTTGNPEDAADALQDALISAFRRADSYRGDAAVTTWLHRIVVNACLDRLRRRKVRAADPLPDDLDEVAARGAVLASPDHGPDPGPEAHVVAAERRGQVLDALEQLPPDQKAALVLVDMEGYPVAEAAVILEVPTGTVKSRCARGRARLAVLLADLGPPGTPGPPGASHSGGPPGDPPPGKPTRTSRRHERAVEGGEQA
jgi:RNA polymerase sigma-70 factor (ECF subfamily)